MELESGLSGEPEKLKERIRRLFAPAKASVDDEPNGAAPAEIDGHGRQRDAAGKAVAGRPGLALHLIVDRRRLDLADLRRRRRGVDAAGDPTITRKFILKSVCVERFAGVVYLLKKEPDQASSVVHFTEGMVHGVFDWVVAGGIHSVKAEYLARLRRVWAGLNSGDYAGNRSMSS